MGYDIKYSGYLTIEPALNQQEIDFLQKFANTRRMEREKGPFYVDNQGPFGQDREDDIINFNEPPDKQPGLWCKWTVNDEGTQLFWNGGPKFQNDKEWLKYLLDYFLRPFPLARKELPFLQGNHFLNGTISAEGENGFHYSIIVVDNTIM